MISILDAFAWDVPEAEQLLEKSRKAYPTPQRAALIAEQAGLGIANGQLWKMLRL